MLPPWCGMCSTLWQAGAGVRKRWRWQAKLPARQNRVRRTHRDVHMGSCNSLIVLFQLRCDLVCKTSKRSPPSSRSVVVLTIKLWALKDRLDLQQTRCTGRGRSGEGHDPEPWRHTHRQAEHETLSGAGRTALHAARAAVPAPPQPQATPRHAGQAAAMVPGRSGPAVVGAGALADRLAGATASHSSPQTAPRT
jgi:hypothetical protein